MSKCIICGAETEWDYTLGNKPLCVNCWDSEAERVEASLLKRRLYYQQHKAEFAAQYRRYYHEHKARLLADDHRYYREHKAERNAYSRRYYQEHKAERAAYDRQYYQEHKAEILERNRLYQKTKRLGEVLARCMVRANNHLEVSYG